MPNCYPRDRFFNQYLTLMKDSYLSLRSTRGATFFRFCVIKCFCIVVAICDQVQDVETTLPVLSLTNFLKI